MVTYTKTYKNVIFTIVFSFFVLAFLLWQTKRNINRTSEGNQVFSELNHQLTSMSNFSERLGSAETASMNFRNTGEEYYLDKFKDDSLGLIASLDKMISLAGITVQQVSELSVLRELVKEKLQMNSVIMNRTWPQRYQNEQGLRIEGKRLSNRISMQLLRIRRENEKAFSANMEEISAASRNYYLITLLICLGSFLVVYFMLSRIQGHLVWRKEAEEQARINEKKYSDLINQAGVVLFTSNTRGDFTFVSHYALKLTGYSPEELLGKNFQFLVEPEWHETVLGFYGGMLQKKLNESSIKFPIITRNGERKWVEQHAVIFWKNNIPSGLQCITRDVTESYLLDEERTKRNEERKRAHLLLQSILDNCPQIIFIKNNDGEYIRFNRQFVEVLELNAEEAAGKTDESLFGTEIAERFRKYGKKLIETQKIVELRQDILYRGEVKKYSFILFPLFDPAGSMLGTCGIGTDITGDVQNHKKLIEALKKAEHAEKLKENFLANMSHEIRTPLNAIIGFGNQLLKQPMDEKSRGFTSNIHAASQHLLVLINDILDISKIEQGKMNLEEIDFNFCDVIHETVAVLSQRAEEKGLRLSANLDPRINCHLKGDPHRLKQVLLNLVGNSIKFTEAGSVEVNSELREEIGEEQVITLSVKDTGIGMEQDYQENLFVKFSQEDKSVTRKYGGTGLGMAITKHLVDLMDGKIEVESVKNKGTVIRIDLRFQKAAVVQTGPAALPATDTSYLRGKRILLVDDVEMNRLVAMAVLSEYGVEIVEAQNGAEAVSQLEKSQFDLVLMDLQMPVLDGINATRAIRKNLRLDLPIIALTASAMRRDNEKCFEAGMNDYITKPFNDEELVAMIQKHLHLRMRA